MQYLADIPHNQYTTRCVLLAVSEAGTLIIEYEYQPHFLPDVLVSFESETFAIQLALYPEFRFLLEDDYTDLLSWYLKNTLQNYLEENADV